MDQAAIVESMGKHLDSLRATIGWAVLVAVVFAHAGLTDADPVTALGLKIDKNHAVMVAAAFYFGVSLKILDLLWRISQLNRLLDDGSFLKGLSAIALHPFIGNPFGYFGTRTVGRLTAAKGLLLLILLWSAANASLLTLAKGCGVLAFGGILWLLGIAILLPVAKFHTYTIRRLLVLDPTLHEHWRALRRLRLALGIITMTAIALAVAAYWFTGRTGCGMFGGPPEMTAELWIIVGVIVVLSADIGWHYLRGSQNSLVQSKRLQTERLSDGRRVLLRDLKVSLPGYNRDVCVPKGFITDFSSIPFFFRPFLQWSRVDIAGVVHDYLYWCPRKNIGRLRADCIWFTVAGRGCHCATCLQRGLGWIGLLLGGWYSWGQARRARVASRGRKCECESLSSTSQGAVADV